jgi:hypothetical protein
MLDRRRDIERAVSSGIAAAVHNRIAAGNQRVLWPERARTSRTARLPAVTSIGARKLKPCLRARPRRTSENPSITPAPSCRPEFLEIRTTIVPKNAIKGQPRLIAVCTPVRTIPPVSKSRAVETIAGLAGDAAVVSADRAISDDLYGDGLFGSGHTGFLRSDWNSSVDD